MRLLIVGGTKFLGPHVVDAALAAGHDVTILHRGSTRFALPPGVRELIGDRESSGLDELRALRPDAVVDTCGYRPERIRASVEALAATRRYVFVSSVSVYADLSHAGIVEDAALHDPRAADSSDAAIAYGAGKAGCELLLHELLGERATVVRPGLIAGPYDPTDRFTYWVERLARGGEILAPGTPQRPVQVVDVRDLAAFIVLLAERDIAGTFNVTGRQIAMGDLLEAGSAAVVPHAPRRLRWIDDATLLARGAGPWMELPLWLGDDPRFSGMLQIDIGRALAAGLRLRDIRETFAATAAWVATLPAERERLAGLAPVKERELLAGAR
ncbi:MAG: NAD-dependent epimerase/dehydratase family protein [Actinobacteria bacterium]|nr:NAD-dependent epimerase/dehydratase family protein [Actinomycetota bacterium]